MLRYLFLLAASPLFALGADDALRDRVTDLLKHRQWVEAQAVLEKTTVAEPTNAEAWYYLGQTYVARNQGEQAVIALEKATALDPANSNYHCFLGDAYGLSALKAGLFSKLGWAKKCKTAYDKAVELDPRNVRARFSLMEFCRQAPGFIGGGMDKAYEQAAEIKKLDPSRGRQAYSVLYVADKKYPEAFALYEDVLHEKPGDDQALFAIGRLAATSGEQLDRGLAALREILSHEGKAGDARTHALIGNILDKKGDKTGARAAYEAALASDPQLVPAMEGLRKLNGT